MPIYHDVRPGDCVGSLAYSHGFFPKTVWDHRENAELKATRCNQTTLAVGDVVFIPDREPKELDRGDQQRHVFRRKGVPAVFRVQLMNDAGPQKNVPYRVILDGKTREGTSDDEGVIEVTLDPSVHSGELLVGERGYEQSFELRLGHLEPVDSVDGTRQRLNNLGFPTPTSGALDDDTVAALRAFQTWAGLEVSGKVDDATRAKLNELHDTEDTDVPKPTESDPAPSGESGETPPASDARESSAFG